MKRRDSIVIASMITFGLLGSGCSSKQPPMSDITNAKMALLKAKEANAYTLAPNAFSAAETAFKQSAEAMDQSDYERAKFAAQKAQLSAALASKKAKNTLLAQERDKLKAEINVISKEFTTVTQ